MTTHPHSHKAATSQDMLRQHGMSVTQTRLKVLDLFLSKGSALAHADIEQGMEAADRVTIYRTLQAFVDKGILHTVPTTDNSIQYALCKDDCGQGQHQDNHIHFSCIVCNTTYCLDEVVKPVLNLPPGFQARRTELVVSGECERCTTVTIAKDK